jgi:hypothetical protein
MSNGGYDVIYYLLCDLVRMENTGKEIIVGAYNDYVVTTSVPLVLPMLCVRISVRLNRKFERLGFELRGPTGQILGTVDGPLSDESNNLEQQSIFNINMGVPIVLPELGEYEIRFGLDEEPRRIGFFIVRLPEGDAEKQRLSVAGGRTAQQNPK